MRMLVDSDHAGDQVTCRSRTGFLVFLNNALIYWTFKKQTTIETSSFGSEFMALITGTECLRGLRFQLRAMGIPVTRPKYVYGDNKVFYVTLLHRIANLRRSQRVLRIIIVVKVLH